MDSFSTDLTTLGNSVYLSRIKDTTHLTGENEMTILLAYAAAVIVLCLANTILNPRTF